MTIHTELPRFTADDQKTGCCPEFHPEFWDHQQFDFKNYSFITAKSKTLFHVPINLSEVMTETQKAIDDAHQNFDDQYLILSEDVSNFKTVHYFLTKGEVPNYPSVKLEGIFEASVFDGPYQDLPKWVKSYQAYLQTEGKASTRLMTFYTTCPDCAKAYGHNYVVLMAQQ